jgi:hypothetical protein
MPIGICVAANEMKNAPVKVPIASEDNPRSRIRSGAITVFDTR